MSVRQIVVLGFQASQAKFVLVRNRCSQRRAAPLDGQLLQLFRGGKSAIYHLFKLFVPVFQLFILGLKFKV